ncbi:unnamed protein product, partial [Porites evermanni]
HSLFACFTASVFCTMHIYFKRKARDWRQCNCGRLEEHSWHVYSQHTFVLPLRMKEMYERNLSLAFLPHAHLAIKTKCYVLYKQTSKNNETFKNIPYH